MHRPQFTEHESVTVINKINLHIKYTYILILYVYMYTVPIFKSILCAHSSGVTTAWHWGSCQGRRPAPVQKGAAKSLIKFLFE